MDENKINIQIGNIFTAPVRDVDARNSLGNSYNKSQGKIGTFLDSSYIPELNEALNMLDTASDTYETKKDILNIRRELNSNKPNVGIIEAAFNNLKRMCTNDKFLNAVKIMGDLIIKAKK